MKPFRDGDISPELSRAFLALALDRATASVTRALAEQGVRAIVLKGPAVANWLYGGDATRSYGDIDLLIQPQAFDLAEATLRELGFVHLAYDAIPGDRPHHARVWSHPQGANVDLHRTISGAELPPERVWEILSARTEPMSVGGREVEVLQPPARALVVVLHAAKDGIRVGKPLEDVSRAIEQLPFEVWKEVAQLARSLDAMPAFAGGLRLLPSGEAVADALDLPRDTSLPWVLRAEGGPVLSMGLDWLLTRPTLRAKAAFLARKLVPPVPYMKSWSRLARRGRAGLALAYLWRPVWQLWHLLPATAAWWRARNKVRVTSQDQATRPER